VIRFERMKFKSLILSLLVGTTLFGQKSEDFIPHDAVTVFSINNISLLQKVSLDELVKYEFMEEVQQELFDGSTSGKTLKDSGLDFDQKLNVFYGRGDDYEVSGFTFGIKNKANLFNVFDDFERIESPYPDVEFYGSYFNNLIIKGNVGILIRVEPTMEIVDEKTDSIWYSRGYENPWYSYDEESLNEEGEEEIMEEELLEEVEEEPITEENYDYPEATEDPNQKNYYELRDSVQLILQTALLNNLCEDLLVKNISLKTQDARFAQQLTHASEGIFFLDNSRNVQKAKGLWYFQTMFPSLYEDMKQLYSGNVLLGDLVLNQDNVSFQLEARYGDLLGSIYEKMNSAKMDKNVLKYIPSNSTAYFTYNVNLREAYEQAYKVIMPLLSDERNPQVSANVLTIELLNEFINKDALFGTYKGSMFGSFNGIRKIKTTKIEFTWDEETYEYAEKEVEAEEDMPIFTVGFSTARADIPEKVLNHLTRLTSRFQNKGNYWVYEDAILESAPLYMINKNGLFIFTNDEDLAINHADGYGSEALGKDAVKRIKSSHFMYAHMDWGKAIDRFPRDFFNSTQNEILDAMRGKTGVMELVTTDTSAEKTNLNLTYSFTGKYENSGKYLLDLLNSIYIISK
jgi:hypothetical protein